MWRPSLLPPPCELVALSKRQSGLMEISRAISLLFNLVGNLYKGLKNTMMVELIVFEILWILNLGECNI